MPRAAHTRWIPHRRYHDVPGGNDEQRRGERGRYPWRRSFFRPRFAEMDHNIEPGAWFAMIDNKKWKMQEWTQREIRKNIWHLAMLKKRPGDWGYKEAEDRIAMLNDILFDLHEATDEEAEEIFADHPLHYHTIAEGPFERLGARSRYPHEAPQWIPSRSREDIRNRIQHYMKHPTKMRPYMGNRGYYNLEDMTYPPRIRNRTYKDYFHQLRKIAVEDMGPELANFGESTYQLGRLLGRSLRSFPYGMDDANNLAGPSPLLSNIPGNMAAEGDNQIHWLLPWSIWRTMRIMPLLSKLMTRGPELQYETYHPTPVEARSLIQSATMRIPRYRLGENIPWNKRVYHMYNNNHGRYGTRQLREMTSKWITRNVPPTREVAQEKSYWSKYIQNLAENVVVGAGNALTSE